MSEPLEANPNATLQVNVAKNFTQEISKNGAWGFMKLLETARCNKMNGSTFSVKWQVNVQNQYMVFTEVRIQVAGSDHPFTDKVFQTFNCPTDLLKAAAEGTTTADQQSTTIRQ